LLLHVRTTPSPPRQQPTTVAWQNMSPTGVFVGADYREPLDVLWRVTARSGVVWECVWWRTRRGFELRVQRADDPGSVIAVRAFSTISEEMQTCADQWLIVITASDGSCTLGE
jgi:hypothetical protein